MARAQQLFRMSGAQQYEIFQGFSEEIAHRNITSGILGSADRERRPLPKELDKAMREILKLVRS